MIEKDYEEAMNEIHNPDPGYDMPELACMIKNLMYEAWDLCEVVVISSFANIAPVTLSNNAISDHFGINELSVQPTIIRLILTAERWDAT